MRKNLLLVTAFLAVTGTAMAVTSNEIGKNYYGTAEARLESLKEGFKAVVPEKLKAENKVNSINAEFDAVTEDLYNKYKDFDKDSDNKDDKTNFEDKLNALVDKVTEELGKTTTTDEDKTKLTNLKGELDKFTAYAKSLDEYITTKAKITAGAEDDDNMLIDKMVEKINPKSYVSDFMFDFEIGERAGIYREANDDEIKRNIDDVLKTNYKNAKDAYGDNTKGAVKDYNDKLTALKAAEKALNTAKANEKAEKEEAVKTAKDNLKNAKVVLDQSKEAYLNAEANLNSVLSIAGTTAERYVALVDTPSPSADKQKEIAAEKARVLKEVKKWKAERQYFENIASNYVYNEDSVDLATPTKEVLAQKAANRITENAINIENNKKAIARNAQDIKDLRKDHNRGMAQMAAMASVDFGNVKARTVKVGAGIGQHSSETAVAVGVAVTPTDALMINAKWSTSANSIKKSTLGLGATYEFNF